MLAGHTSGQKFHIFTSSQAVISGGGGEKKNNNKRKRCVKGWRRPLRCWLVMSMCNRKRKRKYTSRDVSTSRSSTSAHIQELSLRFTQTNATRASTLAKKEIRSIEKKREGKNYYYLSSLHFQRLATITRQNSVYNALEDVITFVYCINSFQIKRNNKRRFFWRHPTG